MSQPDEYQQVVVTVVFVVSFVCVTFVDHSMIINHNYGGIEKVCCSIGVVVVVVDHSVLFLMLLLWFHARHLPQRDDYNQGNQSSWRDRESGPQRVNSGNLGRLQQQKHPGFTMYVFRFFSSVDLLITVETFWFFCFLTSATETYRLQNSTFLVLIALGQAALLCGEIIYAFFCCWFLHYSLVAINSGWLQLENIPCDALITK